MDSSIIVLFKGVCTHLTATHEVANAPKFSLRARNEKIQHRVFLANSALINDEIKADHRPAPHTPKLRIHERHVTEELRKIMSPASPDTLELVLTGYGVTFEGLDPQKGGSKHYTDLELLPSVFFKAKPRDVMPDEHVLEGWSRRTGACVDFPHGVQFLTDFGGEVIAQLSFNQPPAIVLRDANLLNGWRYPLKPNTLLEISNRPDKACSPYDYLLHYLATNADLWIDPPEWPLPPSPPDSVGEVYCTNSTYP